MTSKYFLLKRKFIIFQNIFLNVQRFSMWVGVSLWHSLVLFFLNYGFYASGILWSGGETGGWLMFGNTLYTVIPNLLITFFKILNCNESGPYFLCQNQKFSIFPSKFVVATVCLKALLECDSWTWIIVGCCLGSILLWFAYLAIYAWVLYYYYFYYFLFTFFRSGLLSCSVPT